MSETFSIVVKDDIHAFMRFKAVECLIYTANVTWNNFLVLVQLVRAKLS